MEQSRISETRPRFVRDLSTVHDNGNRRAGFRAPQVAAKAAASNTATVSLDGAAYTHFDTILQSVSEQAHVLIIAEGTPLNPSLSAQQLEALRRAVPEGQPMSAGDAIKSIALAYDYEAQQTDTDTFLLRKRYSDANDLPCVTFEELFSSLREIRKVLGRNADNSADDTEDGETTIAKFIDSLTPAQQQRGQMPDPQPNPFTFIETFPDASHPGIGLSDLSPAQQELGKAALKGVVLDQRLETIDLLVQRYFKTLESGSPDFRWVDAAWFQNQRGARSAFRERLAQAENRIASFRQSVQVRVRPRHSLRQNPAAKLTPINPLVPTAQDRALASGMMASRLPTTLTLQEAARNAAATLPLRSATDTQPEVKSNASTRAAAVKAIADKPVNVFGMRYGRDVRHLMQSLADLYGLQLLVRRRTISRWRCRNIARSIIQRIIPKNYSV